MDTGHAVEEEKQGHLKEVAGLAWPLSIGLLSFTLMGVTDTLLMAKVGTVPLAGVGLGFILSFIPSSFFRGLVTGVQSVVAAADGAGDRPRVLRAGSAGVLLGLASGAVGMLLLWALLPAVPWMANDPDVGASAVAYLEIRALAMPFGLLSFGLLSGLQGLGDTRTRMWVSLIGAGLNIVLDVIFIFGWGPIPAMHEAGAALATVFSTALMALLYFIRHRKLFGRLIRPGLPVLKDAITLGLPSAMQGLLEISAFGTTQVLVARAGAAHLAANQIALNIVSISFLPGFGISEAGGVLVSRFLGLKRPDLAAKALKAARILALGVMCTMGLVFLFGGDWIASAFTEDQEVAVVAAQLLAVAALFQIFDALAMVHLVALRSAGDTRFTLLVCATASWGLTVPCAWFFGLHLGWGAPGAWAGMTLELAFLAAVSAWRAAGVKTGRVGRVDLLLGSPEADGELSALDGGAEAAQRSAA